MKKKRSGTFFYDMMDKQDAKGELLKTIESNYHQQIEGFQSDFCYFEKYGYAATMQFSFAFTTLRSFLSTIKKELKGYSGQYLNVYLNENIERLGKSKDPSDMFMYYEITGMFQALPIFYTKKYDYDFFCKLEDAYNQYLSRMHTKGLKEIEYQPQAPAEEILAHMIFEYFGSSLEELVMLENHYKWKEEDYAIADEESGKRYPKDWLFTDYMVGSGVEMVLYPDLSKPVIRPEELVIGIPEAEEFLRRYLFDNWFMNSRLDDIDLGKIRGMIN